MIHNHFTIMGLTPHARQNTSLARAENPWAAVARRTMDVIGPGSLQRRLNIEEFHDEFRPLYAVRASAIARL